MDKSICLRYTFDPHAMEAWTASIARRPGGPRQAPDSPQLIRQVPAVSSTLQLRNPTGSASAPCTLHPEPKLLIDVFAPPCQLFPAVTL
ncbi:hypothetical protein QQS21_006300 [Conoideocrella luteorostrata]|uniref:Uncharacterized protein n=1 Tax=Conoideocrella luteorostrata TaxID=1105319 RepID=A0AAJ0FYD8_9HYPO|nr:hypothetical protein QQS21_006300 [Conoideocrella luteorostrata]